MSVNLNSSDGTGSSTLPAGARTSVISRAYLIWLVVLTAAFSGLLYPLLMFSFQHDLHSHICLIPLVSGYLLFLDRRRLPAQAGPAWIGGTIFVVLASVAIFAALVNRPAFVEADYYSLNAASFVGFVVGGGFLCMGARWMRAAFFPMAFLVFFVPMPSGMEYTLENWSKLASAEVSEWFFYLAGVPYLRDGTIFSLPGITIEVAQECSGIRSSWVLFISGLLASHLFLRTTWRKVFLVLFVIPLGIVRNAFRILVIGWLCVEVGPHMIDSMIHRRGGPLFFALSLIPLGLVAWWLKWSENRRAPAPDVIAIEPEKN